MQLLDKRLKFLMNIHDRDPVKLEEGRLVAKRWPQVGKKEEIIT